MSHPLIRYGIEESGLCRIILANPAGANTISPQSARELRDAAEAIAAKAPVRAILLSAEGSVFSAGGDLKGFAGEGDNLPVALAAMIDDLHAAIESLTAVGAPIIAVVQGAAGGAGLSLVAMSDIVLASQDAGFVAAYTAAGLTPDGSMTHFLPRLIGERRTMEMMLLNRRLSAEEALDWGLVTQVHPPEALSEAAEKLAARLAAGPTKAFGAVKSLLRATHQNALSEQLTLEKAAIVAASGRPDGREGVAAFVEKRKPSFSGE